MKRTLLLIGCIIASGLSFSAHEPPRFTPAKPPQKRQVVTAAQANGVYRYYDNEFRILALGHNKLKVQFEGIYHTISKSVNTVRRCSGKSASSFLSVSRFASSTDGAVRSGTSSIAASSVRRRRLRSRS